jgi:hypothetical protein
MPCRCPTGDIVLASELGHADLIAEGDFELPVPPYPRHVNQERWAIRHCQACGIWWWMQSATTTHHTYDRSDEQRIVGSVTSTDGNALRCTDRTAAEALTADYPDFAKAAARFQQTFPRFDYGDPPEAAKAYALLQPLLRRHPAARYLQCVLRPDVSLEHWQQADVRVAPLRQRMHALMESLMRQPDDTAGAAELARLQQRCAEVRAAEPVPDWHHVDMSELWTPVLAPTFRAISERQPMLSQQRTLDAAARARFIVLQRCIEAAWVAFLAEARIPAPRIEFRLLVQQLSELHPQGVTVDPAVWDRPERIALRLRTLMQRHGLGWERDQFLSVEVERRLGLPPHPFRPPSPGGW